MRRDMRKASVALLAVAAVPVLSACGKSSSSASKAKGGAVTVLFGTAPDSLDPGMGYTTQALAPDQTAYVPQLCEFHRVLVRAQPSKFSASALSHGALYI